ncbi:MAG: 30S ribosomal protein S12 methylthiotransferase RimO [Leptospirales bacterium]|nr:30S ribosomal protein S12 methylthiotransferase RimO [Leptospirales bacterium]
MRSSSELSFYIIALGCSKNLVDSEKLKGRLLNASFNAAVSSEEADIVIITTCGFITHAKEESIEVIFDAIKQRGEKKTIAGFAPKLAVAGCLTKRYMDDIKKDIPEIDFVYGIADELFPEKMAEVFGIALDSPPLEEQVALTGFLPYRYIKISEGCSNNCSYCAIPLIRGAAKAYSPEQILDDARKALNDGVLELILVAQDTTAYEYGAVKIPDILESVAALPGARWVRLLYCHPDHISDELINCISRNQNIVRYLDIPFQHACAAVLSSMGRRGNGAAYLELVRKIRELIPGARIRSTFMVGYPGESAADFEELIHFLREARLDRVGAFIYSQEEGTPAAAFEKRVSQNIAKKRYARLMETQRQISYEKLSAMIGKIVSVIVEERIDETTYAGRSEFDAPEVDGIFYLTSEKNILNSIVEAVVTDAVEYDLIGEHIETSTS